MAKNADQYRDPYVNIHETMNAYGPIQRLGDGPIGSGEVTANGWDNFELLSL